MMNIPVKPPKAIAISNNNISCMMHNKDDNYELLEEEDSYEMNILTTITSIPHDVDMIIHVSDDHIPHSTNAIGVIIEEDNEADNKTENFEKPVNVVIPDNNTKEESDQCVLPTETAVVGASCEITPTLPSVKQLKSMRMDELRAILSECDASINQTGLKKDALIAAIAPYTTSS